MATFRQASTFALTASGTSILPTWPAATLAGSLLVGVVFSRDSDETPAWTPPVGWTLARASTPTADTPRTLIYYILDSASRSEAESFSHNGVAKPLAAWVEEWEPEAGETITLDQVASVIVAGGGSADRPTGTTPTTGGATIQVGGVANRNGSRTLSSIQDGFTQRVNGVTGTGFTHMVAAGGSKAEAAAEAGATGWTVNNTSGSNASGAIAAFLVTVGGGTTTPIPLAAGMTLGAAITSPKKAPRTVTAGVTFTPVVTKKEIDPRLITAGLTLAPVMTKKETDPRTIAAGLILQPAVLRKVPGKINAGLTLTPTLTVAKLLLQSLTTNLVLAADIDSLFTRGRRLDSTLTLNPSIAFESQFYRTLATALTIAPQMSKEQYRLMQAGLTLAPTITFGKKFNRIVAADLVLNPVIARRHTFVQRLDAALSLAAALGVEKTFLRQLQTVLTLTGALMAAKTYKRTMNVSLSFAPIITPREPTLVTLGATMPLVPDLSWVQKDNDVLLAASLLLKVVLFPSRVRFEDFLTAAGIDKARLTAVHEDAPEITGAGDTAPRLTRVD